MVGEISTMPDKYYSLMATGRDKQMLVLEARWSKIALVDIQTQTVSPPIETGHEDGYTMK